MGAIQRVSEYCPWPQYLVPCPGNQSQLIAPFALSIPTNPMNLSGAPIPPQSNNCYPTVMIKGRPIRVKSSELKRYERDFADWAFAHSTAIRAAKSLIANTMKPGKLIRVDIHMYFERSKILCLDGKPKKHDASNRLKILHDQLAQYLGVDDCWFFDGSFQKRITKDNERERCDIQIEIVDALWMLPA